MAFDKQEYSGGTEYKWLVTPLTKELIRAAVLVVGLLLIFLIIYLI